MAKELASIKLHLLIEPNQAWRSVADIKTDFSKFLAGRNLIAKELNSFGIATGELVIHITQMDKLDQMREEPKKMTPPSVILKKMARSK